MKKLFMMLVCCVLLVGCGGNITGKNNSETSIEANKSDNLYESEKIFVKTIGDAEYPVPESWNNNSKIEGNYTYYYGDKVMLMVYRDDMDGIIPFENYSDSELDEYRNNLLDGLKSGFESYRELSSRDYKGKGGSRYIRYVADVKLKGNDYSLDMVVFAGNNEVYTFGVLIDSDSLKSYGQELRYLRENISINVEFEEEPEQNVEEIFENFKNGLIDSSKELESNEVLFASMQQLIEKNYYDIKEFSSFNDVSATDDNHNKFTEFSVAIAYFDTHFDEGSVGKAIGEDGWESIKSLMLEDGEFINKMDKLKRTYELIDSNHLFEKRYDSGQYKVGNDIPEGEYVMFTDSSSGYFGLTSDANGNDIIANENFNYNSIISVRDGEYLELSRCYAVPIEEVAKLPVDKANMFKIGTHLPVGEYKVIADEDRGYYCVYGDDRQDNIVSNDNFSGQSYVTVSDGQYLVLSRCHIEQ